MDSMRLSDFNFIVMSSLSFYSQTSHTYLTQSQQTNPFRPLQIYTILPFTVQVFLFFGQ